MWDADAVRYEVHSMVEQLGTRGAVLAVDETGFLGPTVIRCTTGRPGTGTSPWPCSP